MCPNPRVVASTLAVALSVAAPVEGQAILNVERLQVDTREGFSGTATAAGSYAAGNTDVLQLDAALGAAYRGARHWPRLFAGGELLRSGNGRIVDNRFAHLRYGYLFSPRVRSFHFVQVQSNNNLLVAWRVLVGTGLRRRISMADRLTLELGSGPMLERERLDRDRVGSGVPLQTSVVRLATVGVVRWQVGADVTLLNVAYHQPAVGAFGDFRLLDDLTLSSRLGRGLSVDVTLNWRHDSRPPPEVDGDDVRLRVGLALGWGP